MQSRVPEEATTICEHTDHTCVKAGFSIEHKMAGWMMITGGRYRPVSQFAGTVLDLGQQLRTVALYLHIRVLQKKHNRSDTLDSTAHFSTPE